MQGVSKRYKIGTVAKVSWLNLHFHIPQKDVRKIIYGKLDRFDRDVVTYSHNINTVFSTDCMKHCANKGYFSLLKWLKEHGIVFRGTECEYAAMHGNLEILEWLYEQGCPPNRYALYYAAKYGYIHILKWSIENELDVCYDGYTCAYAAEGGQLQTLKWLYEQGCVLTSPICSWAAANGHLHVIKWAREHGCDWNEYTCSAAARRGHLNVLQWAISNGCPWNANDCMNIETAHIHIKEWIQQIHTFKI